MRSAIVLLLIVFLVSLVLFAILVGINAGDPRTQAAIIMTLPLMPKIYGILIAAASAAGLFLLAMRGEPVRKLVLTILPLLGGVLLIQPHWGVAIALAVITVVFLVDETQRNYAASRQPSEAAGEAPAVKDRESTL